MAKESVQPRVDREVVTAKVSRKSADGLRKFCAENGITITALIEVTGEELAKETAPPRDAGYRRMVLSARQIDLERRSRKP